MLWGKRRIKWIHYPPVGGSSHIPMDEQFQVTPIMVIKDLEQNS